MKKSIKNLGKSLSRDQQKEINGGFGGIRYCKNPGGYCDALHVCEPLGNGQGVCISIYII